MESSRDLYRDIEARYGFSLPAEYRHMKERGWFDSTTNTMPYFNPTGQSYLWMNEMEWMPLHSIRAFEFPGYCKPGFIPFAFTGGGDHWCWYPEYATNGVTPVVLCPHDDMMAEFYAPDFLGSVYRQMLDFAASNLDEKDEPLARQHLKRWHDDLGPMFPASWRATIAKLQTAPVQSWEVGKLTKFKQVGLLSPREYRLIVERDLPFDKLDETFQWMVD
jgi:hypothetical protein